MKKKIFLYIGILFLILVLLIIISAGMGYVKISFSSIIRIIADSLFSFSKNDLRHDEIIRTIILDVRLPRILTAAAVGAGLAVSGSVFQGILLNPLADPYTLGVSAGAAFGACIAILLSLGSHIYSTSLFAFAGAASTLFFVIYLSLDVGVSNRQSLSSNNLILSGIIVASILSAGISFLKYIADEQVSIIIFWLMGSFASKTWLDVIITWTVVIAGSAVSVFFARDLNIIALGARSASTLGVDIKKITLILLVSATLITAVCVSVSGIIGFVGLLIPHMVRLLTGPDNGKVIPVSFLAGSVLLLFADTMTRAVLPGEIPIGVLTALIGGPVFCYIFRKNHMDKRGRAGR